MSNDSTENKPIIPLHDSDGLASTLANDPTASDRPFKESATDSSGSARQHSDVGDVLARHESVGAASSLASIDRPPGAEEHLPAAKIYHPLSLPVLALLMPASVFGTLVRLGLQALATYQGQSIFPLSYPQALGCFIMGFALEFKEPFGQFYGPLYTAITTGFCGSVTTFSSWQFDVFSSWVNSGQFHRGGVRDAVDGVTKTIFTLIISLSSVSFGAHVASLCRPLIPRLHPPPRWMRYSWTILAVLIYAATYPPYFCLPDDYRHQATAALLFSYPGTLSRYLLSLFLNPLLKALPLGTFAANMFGTALLGAFHVIQGARPPISPNSCAIVQGLEDGYCGCLTTVSTFAAEVAASVPRRAWFYGVTSWITAQLLLVLIVGSSYWAGHISEQTSCRFA